MVSNQLKALLAEINKKYGEGTILPASEAKALVTDRLPSGIFDLDMKIGGGWPRGRVSVLKGEFSTGKSAICLKTAVEAQRHCRHCGKRFEYQDVLGEIHEFECQCGLKEPMRVVWLDAEHSFDSDWAKKYGVDVANILVIQTEYAEQAIDVADQCIRSKQCDLLVVDSIAALTPGIEVEESAEKWQMGVMARLMGKALRKWTSGLNSFGLVDDIKCTILLINQLRMNIGGYGASITSPGGKAIDFFESVEIRLKKDEAIVDKGTERPVGVNVSFEVKKNKTAPLSSGGMFGLYFVAKRGDYSIGDTDTEVQVARLAAYWGIIKKAGAGWYTLPDGTKCQGDEKLSLAMKNNPSLFKDLMDRVRERELMWVSNGIQAPDEDEEDD